MTVRLVDGIRKYIGLAADTKPEHGASSTGEIIPPGSRFLEIDTMREYLWSSTAWYFAATVMTTSTA